MASIKVTNFTEYQLTEDEYIPAVSFTELQTMYLKNELALWIQKKVLVGGEGMSAREFVKAHEYHRGAIEAITALLDTSEDAEQLLRQQMKDRSVSQQTED